MSETAQALTAEAIDKFARDWYRALDVHVPVTDLVPQLAPEGLEMVFPEATLQGVEAFKGWYHDVTNKFFDEVHNVTSVESALDGDRADVKVWVNWQAKVWNPPAAKSEWLGFDADQTWEVVAGPDGRPQIKRYVVNALHPMAGSSNL